MQEQEVDFYKNFEVDTNTFREFSEEEINYATAKFMQDLLALRKAAAVTPVRCEPVYLTEAAELCSVAVTGNNVSNLLALQEEMDKLDEKDWLAKNIGYIIAILAIGALPLMAYMLIK